MIETTINTTAVNETIKFRKRERNKKNLEKNELRIAKHWS